MLLNLWAIIKPANLSLLLWKVKAALTFQSGNVGLLTIWMIEFLYQFILLPSALEEGYYNLAVQAALS